MTGSNVEEVGLSRSPELMNPEDTALLVVDMQEGFARTIPEFDRLVWNIRRLLDGAARFNRSPR